MSPRKPGSFWARPKTDRSCSPGSCSSPRASARSPARPCISNSLRPGLDYAVNRYRREAERHYRVLNEHLEGRTYIVGETRTIADISAWGWLDRASRVRKGAEDPLESFPDLKATVLGFGARRDSMKVFERNDGDARRMGRPSPEKGPHAAIAQRYALDRKSTRLNSSQ